MENTHPKTERKAGNDLAGAEIKLSIVNALFDEPQIGLGRQMAADLTGGVLSFIVSRDTRINRKTRA
ncbi:MAG: hypothetical protein WA728_19950 [Xanthobacteraceae bacterium]